jgi:pimeloyl-ACP methyl ester carboxylesterase
MGRTPDVLGAPGADTERHATEEAPMATTQRPTADRPTTQSAGGDHVAADRATSRFDVTSTDGTSIAVWVDGVGPPLVLVHGSIADHTTFDPFVDVLRTDFTTFSMDRRGFGASGDAPGYAIERDFEDVAAVVDAVAERCAAAPILWGHSYGANAALGAAALTPNVHRLVVYEPSLGLRYPPGAIDAVEAAVAAGDMERAIVMVLVDVLELSGEEVDAIRSSPMWPTRLAAAPTIPRECRVEEEWVDVPGRFAGITAPTLFLSGSGSVPEIVAATQRAVVAVPGARVRVLDGHAHFAHKSDPAMVRDIIQELART